MFYLIFHCLICWLMFPVNFYLTVEASSLHSTYSTTTSLSLDFSPYSSFNTPIKVPVFLLQLSILSVEEAEA